jgi:homogentisate phytyltransferase/homogentisate geranylgeranyltransferase
MKIFNWFKRIIARIEDPLIPLGYFILIFISSMTLRNFLEIFSDSPELPFRLFSENSPLFFAANYSLAISFAHYYVFWIFTFLLLSLLFSWITKTNILLAIKALFAGSLIIIITPLFDLMLTRGRGIEIAYAHPENLFYLFPLPEIVTPGMLATSICGVILSFSYCAAKTKKWVSGLLAAAVLYILLILLSALPAIIKAYHPLPIIRTLGIGIFLEIIVILFLAKPAYMRAVLSGLRCLRMGYYLAMFFLGISISRAGFIQSLTDNFSCLILTVIAFVLSWIGAIMLNDVEDYEIDIISNKDRLLVKNIFTKNQLQNLSLWLFAAACIFAAAVNFTTLFFTALLIANSCIYSLPPLRLRRIPVFSKSLIAFNSLLLVILGWLFAGKDIPQFPRALIWYFLVFVTLAANLIDLKDYQGDKQARLKTLAVILGMKKARFINGLFILIAYSALGLVFLDKYILIGGIGLGLLQFFLITRGIFREKPLLLINFCGIAALLFYLNSPLWLK